jgi:hypothetical protein
MDRFILRFRGPSPGPAEDIQRIRSLRRLTVIDDSSPRMLLVEAPETELKALVDSMPGWIVTQEKMVPLPDPRPKPRKSDDM